jgi:hypothetical protein
MEQVAIISQQQYELLIGQQYTEDSFFNPVKDCLNNWIISEQEIEF